MITIIEIGYIGDKSCYVNLTEEQAVSRYCDKEKVDPEYVYEQDLISTITVDEEFGAYDIWETE